MANFYRRVCSALLVLSLLVGVLPTQRVQAAPGTSTVSGAEESLQADKIAVALAVTAMPEKLTYTEFTEELDVTGGQIKVYWSDGTSQVMDMTREMVTGFDNTRTGTQTLTVTYGQVSATFQVEVVAKTAQSISVTRLPDKLTYLTTYEELDVTGGEITVTYADGTPAKVIPMTREMVTGFDNTQLGPQTLTVTYAGAETTYEIELERAALTLTQFPRKLTYIADYEDLDVTGGKLQIAYQDGTILEEIPMTPEMVTGFDNTRLGPQTLTVTCAGGKTTYEVEIVAATLSRISVSQLPEQTVYLWNVDSLNLEGATIKLYFNNNTSSEIPITADMVTGFDNTREGIQTLTVTYQGKTATFQVTVKKNNTTQFASGLGTKEWPYIILTKEHLNNVRLYRSSYFRMMEDVVFTEADFQAGGAYYGDGQGWQPIGDSIEPFTGTFDGNGHTVIGLKINAETLGGLFGHVENGQIIKLGMLETEILAECQIGTVYTGAIAGFASGSVISNCFNSGTIRATALLAYAGGIVGEVYHSVISDCYNTGEVLAYSSGTGYSAYAGGIAGDVADCTISNCDNMSTITVLTGEFSNCDALAGGIAGDVRSSSTLNGCSNAGTISASASAADADAYAGGIVGNEDESSTIHSCRNTGAITASADSTRAYAGGIVGFMWVRSAVSDCNNAGAITAEGCAGGISGYITDGGMISKCYNTGMVGSDMVAGGIAGIIYSGSSVRNSYNIGTISADCNAGGIVGEALDGKIISGCYNAGAITAEDYAGGIAGECSMGGIESCYNTGAVIAANADGISGKTGNDCTIRNCYYLNTDKAANNSRTGGAVACTLEEMTRQETFQGLDFETVWTMEGSPEYGYPELIGMTTVSPCKANEHATILTGEKTPTCTEPGYTGDVYCTACGIRIEKGQVQEASGHSYGEPVFNWSEDGKSCTVVFTCENDESHVESLTAEITHKVTTPATCESKGVTTYTAKVNFQGEDYTATKEVADVAALGHNYGKPVFNWSSDGKSCTVVFTCENDESHVQKLRADITAEITTPATCGVAGETTYTASVTLENRKYSDTLTLADIPALAHDPRLENVREATDTQDGYTGDLVCAHCGEILEKGQAYELIFRVYHQASGKHHYTADAVERDALVAGGWIYEGVAWNAPKEGKPIYRVYHPATGNHLYTMDASERDFLAANGWNYEGILCYSADSDGVPLYRVCNPYTDRNPHHYTDSLEECAFLQSNGWRIEGISWYGLSK